MNRLQKELTTHIDRARHELGLTFRGLAEAAGMKHSYLAMIQRGDRGVGPNVAERLATALQLQDTDRKIFLDLAAQTTGRKTKTPEQSNVQQMLGHVLAVFLRMQKVDTRSIKSLGCIEVGCPFGGVTGRLWTACVRGAKPGPLKTSVQQHLRASKRGILLVVFLPGDKQAILDAGFTSFSD